MGHRAKQCAHSITGPIGRDCEHMKQMKPQEPATGPYPEPIESLRSILVLPSDLYLGLPNGLFPWDFLTIHFSVSVMRATCPARLILLGLITVTIFGEGLLDLRYSPTSLYFLAVTFPPHTVTTLSSEPRFSKRAMSREADAGIQVGEAVRSTHHSQSMAQYCILWNVCL